MHDHAMLGSTAQEELRSSHTYQGKLRWSHNSSPAGCPAYVMSCMTIRSHLPNPCTTQYNDKNKKFMWIDQNPKRQRNKYLDKIYIQIQVNIWINLQTERELNTWNHPLSVPFIWIQNSLPKCPHRQNGLVVVSGKGRLTSPANSLT